MFVTPRIAVITIPGAEATLAIRLFSLGHTGKECRHAYHEPAERACKHCWPHGDGRIGVTVSCMIVSGGRMPAGRAMIKGKNPFNLEVVAASPPLKMAAQLNLDGGRIPAATKIAPGSPAAAVRDAFRRTGRIPTKMTFG
jgi:hypothetical protein